MNIKTAAFAEFLLSSHWHWGGKEIWTKICSLALSSCKGRTEYSYGCDLKVSTGGLRLHNHHFCMQELVTLAQCTEAYGSSSYKSNAGI